MNDGGGATGSGVQKVLRTTSPISIPWMDQGERPPTNDWIDWKTQFVYGRVTIAIGGGQWQGLADDGRRHIFLIFLGLGGQNGTSLPCV